MTARFGALHFRRHDDRDRDQQPGQDVRGDAGPRRRGSDDPRRLASTACWARTAPGRPPPSACSRRCSSRRAAGPSVLGHDVVADAAAVRQEGQPHRPVRLRRRGSDRPREPGAGEPAPRPVLDGRPEARHRAAGRVRARGRGRQAGADLLGRHATPHRHRRQPGHHARRSSSWTSRRRVSTRAAGTRCGISSARSPPDGTTVLLTTQYLEEADRLAERLAVIDHGRVIAEGTSRDLKASIGSNTLHFHLVNPEQRAQAQAVGRRHPRGRRLARDRSDGVRGQGDGCVAGRGPAGRAGAREHPGHRVLPRRAQPRRRLLRVDRAPGGRRAKTRPRKPARRARHERGQPFPTAARRSSCGRARSPPPALSATGTLAWRAMLKIKHVPFQLFDVTITPIMFTLLFTYMFGGALGRIAAGLHPVPAPRDPGADHHLHHRLHGRRPQHRHPEGPLRPLPLAADVAAGADPRRARRRSVPLLGGLGADHRPRRDPRLPPGGRRRGRVARVRAGARSSPSRCRGSGSSSA